MKICYDFDLVACTSVYGIEAFVDKTRNFYWVASSVEGLGKMNTRSVRYKLDVLLPSSVSLRYISAVSILLYENMVTTASCIARTTVLSDDKGGIVERVG